MEDLVRVDQTRNLQSTETVLLKIRICPRRLGGFVVSRWTELVTRENYEQHCLEGQELTIPRALQQPTFARNSL